MNVIYYYCFLFYTKILNEDEPHTTSVWVLGFLEGFFASVIFDTLSIRYFCFDLGKWTMISISLLFILGNHFYFNSTGRAKKIIEEKPMFFSNHKISIVLTSLFFIILSSSMFLGAFYTKYLLETYCGK